MVAVVVPVEEPPIVEPTPPSSGAYTSHILCCSLWHLGLIPSTVEEYTPIVPSVRPMVVAEAVATVPAVAATPVPMPVSSSLLDL